MSNYKGKFLEGESNNPWNIAIDLVKDNSKVLDVGCSNGEFGQALKKYKNCVVDGVEPDKGDSKKAQNLLDEVYPGTLTEALSSKFSGRTYDHAIFLDVIEHLVDPVNELVRLKNNLTEDGSVIFSIPNMAHVSTRIMLLGGDFEYGNTGLLDNTHLHYYTRNEIERVFNEAGYIIETLAHTEAVYTSDLIIRELSKIGVNDPSIGLVNLLSSNDARIFQYVGEARVGHKKNKPRKQYSPDPQAVISSWFEEQAEILNAAILERNLEIESLKKQLEEAATQKSHFKNWIKKKGD